MLVALALALLGHLGRLVVQGLEAAVQGLQVMAALPPRLEEEE
jgi:hypothetical protein